MGAEARLRFLRSAAFHDAVTGAVTQSLRQVPGAWPPTGGRRLARKALVLLVWFGLSYALLLFWARAWWQAVPVSLSLGLSVAALGFNVQHDANHGSLSRSPRLNRLLGLTLDVLGGSSYVWRWKHNFFHHTYTNVAGHDADINGAPLVRLSDSEPRRPVHRWQHIYCWPLYALFPLRWEFWDDYKDLGSGRIEGHRFPRPRGWEAAGVAAGKLVFLGWTLLLPSLRHGFAPVAACYLLAAGTLGTALALSAQLSHCVDGAVFPVPEVPGGGERPRLAWEWAEHQVLTTSDFARGRVANWFWGGLNFQIEHHLFPWISHVHYPLIAPVVAATCARFGLPYRAHRSFFAAVAAHARYMRRLGRPPVALPAAVAVAALAPAASPETPAAASR